MYHWTPQCPLSLNVFRFNRDNKTMYSESILLSLGRSDPNLEHLVPVYELQVHREPPVTHTVQRWSKENEEVLKDCFETIVWDVICDDHEEDIDSLITRVMDYIDFCVGDTVPTRIVWCFSNNKLWITTEIKAVLNQKNAERKIKGLIRDGKEL